MLRRRKNNILLVFVLCLLLTYCSGPYSYNPIVGQWEMVRGEANLPHTLDLQLRRVSEYTMLVADDNPPVRRTWWGISRPQPLRQFKLTLSTSSVPLDYQLPTSLFRSATPTLILTDVHGNTYTYRRISYCSTEMAPPCGLDKELK